MHHMLQGLSCCRSFWLISFATMVSMLCGCGPSGPAYWPVSGQVTFHGQPVKEATIRFSNPNAGVDVTAELDADSNYVIVGEKKGLPEGTYQVAITPILNYDNIKQTPSGMVIPSSMPSPKRADIPFQYQDVAASGLTMTVKPEANTFNVDMK